ncbi:MAG: hypothetical protein M3R36_17080 [Bacteroidota bacterium]|nr:hypothetical protein [Bacteroidota bacterium]
MLNLNKNYIVDKNKKPIAVQIPIKEFEIIEEILENYGLSKLMDETNKEKTLLLEEAKDYYQTLKNELDR